MRNTFHLGICALALGLAANVASADVITIALTGHVQGINDPSLGITLGEAVTAVYSYDTSTAASGPASEGTGLIYPLVSPPANISASIGGQTFQAQSGWQQQIQVTQGAPLNDFDYQAQGPGTGGQGTAILDVSFRDSTGQWLSPPSLPTTAPPQSLIASGVIGGVVYVDPTGHSGVTVQIDTATLVPSITVSPANSSFIAQQNFDAVLLLSAQLSVTSMQASVGGNAIGFSYPGTCQLAQPNNAQRTALICPSAAAVLAGLGGGPVTINWLITLADGSTLQQSVIWSLVL